MTAPEARPGGLDSNARGLMVLGVALVVGFLLLYSWGGGSSSASKSGGTTATTVDTSKLGTTTTAAEQGTTTTAASGHTPSEVSVLVLNGSGQTGAASTFSATIGEGGYTMKTPGNAPANAATTTIYYAPDYQPDAIAVAGLLGKGTDAVKPLSEASLGSAAGDADVVVVLGADTPPVSGTTTTTAAGGSTGSSTTTTTTG